jgi:hypothetical protein
LPSRDDSALKILLELQKREACKPRALAVQLEDGLTVTAQVYIYEGRNLIADSMPLVDKAAIVKSGRNQGPEFRLCQGHVGGIERRRR